MGYIDEELMSITDIKNHSDFTTGLAAYKAKLKAEIEQRDTAGAVTVPPPYPIQGYDDVKLFTEDTGYGWSCIDDNYDGAPDAVCITGWGQTEQEAIADYWFNRSEAE